MQKAIDLFTPGGRQRVLEGRYVVHGVPVLIEQTDTCYDPTLVHARLPGDMGESWGMDIKLPVHFKLATVEQLDAAVKALFDRYADPFAPCPKCGQQTWNRKRFPSIYRDERCGDCWHADFKKQMAAWQTAELSAQRAADVQQYHEGMRWRTSCWVHPRAGDDFPADLYTVERLTATEAEAALRRKYPDAVKFDISPIYQLPSH